MKEADASYEKEYFVKQLPLNLLVTKIGRKKCGGQIRPE